MKRLAPLTLIALAFAAFRAARAPSPVATTTQDAVLGTAKQSELARHRVRAPMGASARLVQIVVGEPAELADGAVVADEASDVPATSGGSADRGEALRERIRQGERGTYIGEILLARDSSLARWPDRRDAPLRVWVADGATIANWDASFPQRVRDAFSTWERVGIPMRFVFAVDSTDADIHVGWVDHFDAPISGKTLWSRDRHWWIVGGNITLALHHNQGEPLDGSAVYAIALHEVGHLLGLDHTADPSNIMTAKVRVRELSDADRATVRLLYSLPPGSVK